MKYKQTTQQIRIKFLQQKPLSSEEQKALEKDFKGKDYMHYQSDKDKRLLLPEQYMADATYRIVERRIAGLPQTTSATPTVLPDPQTSSTHRRSFLYSAAAAIAVLLITTLGIYLFHQRPETVITSTTYGERKQIILPDGSTVILNSLSSVSYPENLHKNHLREIELKGEAFFDVVKDPQRPFVVKSNRTTLKVLGTRFDLSAYQNDEKITARLYEGAVSVAFASGEAVRLNPGEKAVYNKKTNEVTLLTISTMNTSDHSEWIKGHLYFENQPLKEIFSVLKREKEISLNISPSVNQDLKITAQFTQNESIEEILEYLSETGAFTFERKGQTYFITNQKENNP